VSLTVEAPDDLEISLGDERPHIQCCETERFFCGRPYHPELAATEDDDEDECCPVCVDNRYAAQCPPHRPTHAHCPLDRSRICGLPRPRNP